MRRLLDDPAPVLLWTTVVSALASLGGIVAAYNMHLLTV